MIAHQQRLLARAHRPATGGRVAIAAHDRVHHLAVHGADRSPRPRHALRYRTGLVHQRAGLAKIRQLRRAFDQAQQPDKVGGIDQLAKPGERGIDHLAALRGEAIGVVLHTDPLSASAIIAHHVAQFARGVRTLAIGPDPDVRDDGGDAGLPLVRRARQQCQGAVSAKIHPLEHAVAAGVVAGQIIHALLAKDQQTVETGLGHLLAGATLAGGKFLAGEVECHASVAVAGQAAPVERWRAAGLPPAMPGF